jgi:ribosome-binding protein aMBF1 (putative translation factor)
MKKNSSQGNPKTINEHFDKKYGEPGSKSRNEFEQKSEAFMVAELVKDSRKKAHMTQEQLAKKLNVNRAYISKIERASSDVRISTLRRIIETGLGGKLHINVDL